jgi:hypothetical protein
MTRKIVTGNRLRTVFKRQKSPSWDKNYQPGILATREEAPDISRASILTPGVLGRRFHCLSEPEKYFSIFGFYSQRFAGVQEQRMMPAHPIPHPLFTMPAVTDKRLPILPGTLTIAERIGATNILSTGSLPAENEGKEPLKIILPFFSDILWALRESDGSVNKCINWNIKDEEDAFSKPAPQKRRGKASVEGCTDGTIARHTLERLYHEEACIRTVQLGLDQLDEIFRENLRRLFGHHRRSVSLDQQLQEALKERFITALLAGIPPFDVILDLKRRYQFNIHDAQTFLWQLIWRRELRADLFSTLLIDRPLKPESIDPLDKYADWFRG